MSGKLVKYSIVVPVKNSLKYLPECINSVVRQNYSNYELIISDDHSIDETKKYLETINHPNIRIVYPDKELSVIGHFEFAIRHAVGEWIMTLGGDDGLQPYFFKLADKLTDIARKKNIRAIASQRAYYYWEGCRSICDMAVYYSANFNKPYTIKTSSLQVLKVLLQLINGASYHTLPTMYTTSLFHSSLIREAMEYQKGKLFVFNFPDANLAAISTTLEKKYIDSAVPLGWVGTSPHSVFRDDNVTRQLKNLPKKCGDYDLGSCEVYLWGALLSINILRTPVDNKLIASKSFLSVMFGGVLFSLRGLRQKEFKKKEKMLSDIISINECSRNVIKLVSYLYIFLYLTRRFCNLLLRVFNKVSGRRGNIVFKVIRAYERPKYIRMEEASALVSDLVKKYDWVQ
jgi:glycosyltransferase involved in cell wall biosynthesis